MSEESKAVIVVVIMAGVVLIAIAKVFYDLGRRHRLEEAKAGIIPAEVKSKP